MVRVGLDHAAVVAAAAALADERGFSALTLADLAERLHVKTPSLYNHIQGLASVKRDLALLGLRALADCLRRAAVGKAGDDAILAFANAYRAYVKAHPGVYEATALATLLDDHELQRAGAEVVNIVLATLAYYGLADDDAIHATRGLRSVVHGFATLEVAGGFGMPQDIDESFHWLVLAYIAGLRVAS
jgi:AcrR family transcriptional regulator